MNKSVSVHQIGGSSSITHHCSSLDIKDMKLVLLCSFGGAVPCWVTPRYLTPRCLQYVKFWRSAITLPVKLWQFSRIPRRPHAVPLAYRLTPAPPPCPSKSPCDAGMFRLCRPPLCVFVWAVFPNQLSFAQTLHLPLRPFNRREKELKSELIVTMTNGTQVEAKMPSEYSGTTYFIFASTQTR
jgi:hypothetical protein